MWVAFLGCDCFFNAIEVNHDFGIGIGRIGIGFAKISIFAI